jgi:phosphonate transport system ATP-binding protein
VIREDVSIVSVTASIEDRCLVDNIVLSIVHGERVAIIGQNGAGKSSLLKLIAGSLRPSCGAIDVLGHRLDDSRSRREIRDFQSKVGQVFQGLHLVQRLTVIENVLLGSLARNRSWLTWVRIFPSAEVERAQAALKAVGLAGKAAMRVDRLSGGERQKAAIARMLMQAPQLILADEPTAALDPAASFDVAVMLAALARQEGMTLVSVVHDPGLLHLIADRVLGMRQGRIVFDLPVNDVDGNILNLLYRDAGQPDRRIGRVSCQPHSFNVRHVSS